MSPTNIIIASLLIPIIGAVLIWIVGRQPNVRETVTIITSVLLFSSVVQVLPNISNGERPELLLLNVAPG